MENQEKKPKNPSAYPGWDMTFTENPNSNPFSAGTSQGMTLRDYFAAKAMQGLLSNPDWMHIRDGSKFLMNDETIADVSFSVADAMLKEREKE